MYHVLVFNNLNDSKNLLHVKPHISAIDKFYNSNKIRNERRGDYPNI